MFENLVIEAMLFIWLNNHIGTWIIWGQCLQQIYEGNGPRIL